MEKVDGIIHGGKKVQNINLDSGNNQQHLVSIRLDVQSIAQINEIYLPTLNDGAIFIKNAQLTFAQRCILTLYLPKQTTPYTLQASVIYWQPLNQVALIDYNCLLRFDDRQGRDVKSAIDALLQQKP